MIDIKALGNISNVKLFRDGVVLVKENEINPELMYIILNGNVEIIKGYGTETAVVQEAIGTGQIFGEQCLFTKTNPIASYVTKTPISAICISKEYFMEITQNKPHLVLTIVEELCNELAEARAKKPVKKASVTAAAAPSTKFTLLPEKHKGYPIPQPETYSDYLLQANKTCPYCKTVFKTDLIYSSKLRLKAPAGIDMRKTYTDFEPAWYNVITCPHCYFSSFDEYFEREDIIYKSPEVVKTLEEIRKSYTLNFDEERNLEFVLICYYIALACAKAYDNDLQIQSKLWLDLTYFYKDLADEEMYRYALEKAKETFEKFYGAVNMKPESEQYCCLVLAYLCLEMGDEKQGIMYLNNARTNKAGISVYKTMAENKYYDIKEAKDFEKKQNKK